MNKTLSGGTSAAVRETFRLRRGDGRWLLHWPRAALTGRFPDHDGTSIPGSGSRTS
jgi:hypothetical protein